MWNFIRLTTLIIECIHDSRLKIVSRSKVDVTWIHGRHTRFSNPCFIVYVSLRVCISSHYSELRQGRWSPCLAADPIPRPCHGRPASQSSPSDGPPPARSTHDWVKRRLRLAPIRCMCRIHSSDDWQRNVVDETDVSLTEWIVDT